MRAACRFARAGFLTATAVVLAGCRQDMHDQPRYEPLQASGFFRDQQASRHLPPGTVARGMPISLPAARQPGDLTQPSNEFPLPLTKELMQRGRETFNVFCSPCHGETGAGGGMIVQRGFRPPPSFHEARLREAPTGHFFDVITNGFGAMPKYGYRVAEPDRWAVIAYIRALQLSQSVKIDELPPDKRRELEQERTQ